jgi:hypothetical protein
MGETRVDVRQHISAHFHEAGFFEMAGLPPTDNTFPLMKTGAPVSPDYTGPRDISEAQFRQMLQSTSHTTAYPAQQPLQPAYGRGAAPTSHTTAYPAQQPLQPAYGRGAAPTSHTTAYPAQQPLQPAYGRGAAPTSHTTAYPAQQRLPGAFILSRKGLERMTQLSKEKVPDNRSGRYGLKYKYSSLEVARILNGNSENFIGEKRLSDNQRHNNVIVRYRKDFD